MAQFKKILSSKQMREADAYTIEHEPIASIDLMERAASACMAWFKSHFNAAHKVAVVCGQGNNGGDGLVMARHLAGMGYPVTCYVVVLRKTGSPDFEQNLVRLETVDVLLKPIHDEVPDFSEYEIIIDTIFGSGLTRPVDGLAEQVIRQINAQKATVISIDLPSGLFSDDNSENHGAIISASHTLTLELPKLALFLPENSSFIGEWHVIPIHLDSEFIEKQDTPYHYLTTDTIRALYRPRNKFSHKGSFGHVKMVAGSKGKIGACVLSVHAAMRTGAGLVTAYTPSCGYSILQSAIPEVMVETDQGEFVLQGNLSVEGHTIGIGPGLGTAPETVKFVAKHLKQIPKPLVVDADTLNILASNPHLMEDLPNNSILTPHPGEFKRLVGAWSSDIHKLNLLRTFAQQTKCIIVLKGAYTAISDAAGNVYFNTTGNPGMATAGSGDVLTGMITSLLAQGYTPLSSALFGVYLHGLAGDLAAMEVGQEALIASDIINQIGNAYKTFNDE